MVAVRGSAGRLGAEALKAGDKLFESLYTELRALARRQIRRRGYKGTLDTGALIHEAYLKLAGDSGAEVRDRGHFLALASRVMRQVVVDYTRRQRAAKRGGGLPQALSDSIADPVARGAEDLLALNEALERLEDLDPRLAGLVDMRFFGGLSVEEAAEALKVSVATVKRDWLKARAFLYSRISPSYLGS
jgi:RNA polymerase sigma factor (TIGR02999 family)